MPDMLRTIEWMVEKANDNSLGYSQSDRWGEGNADCSSFVIRGLRQGGFDTGNATFTGNMRTGLCKVGWRAIRFDTLDWEELVAGDILLNEANHTELYIGDGKCVGARHDENGGINGRAGDQTGEEVSVTWATWVQCGGWDYVLRRLETSNVPQPALPPSDRFTVTCKESSRWRTSPSKTAPLVAEYAAGAVVECTTIVEGEDPYGDERNRWYKSFRRGLYCWEGNVEGW